MAGIRVAEPTILDLLASTSGGAEMSVSNRVEPFRSWLVRVWRESDSLLWAVTLAVMKSAKQTMSKRGNSIRVFKGVT